MFSRNSFSSLSFSLNSFKMAQADESARSGHWRLFFYNMQAEALEGEQKQREEAPQGKSSRAQKESADKPLKRTKQKQVRADEQPEPERKESPAVTELPIYRRKEIELPDITPFLNVISNEFRAMLVSSDSIIRMLLQKQEEEEDEEEVELLLLLSAA